MEVNIVIKNSLKCKYFIYYYFDKDELYQNIVNSLEDKSISKVTYIELMKLYEIDTLMCEKCLILFQKYNVINEIDISSFLILILKKY